MERIVKLDIHRPVTLRPLRPICDLLSHERRKTVRIRPRYELKEVVRRVDLVRFAIWIAADIRRAIACKNYVSARRYGSSVHMVIVLVGSRKV